MADPGQVIVLDAGPFIAYERGDQQVRGLLEIALINGTPVVTSAAVVAQVWKGSPRQARLNRLVSSGLIDEFPLDADAARLVGRRCADAGVSNVVGGHIAQLTDDLGATALTSDHDDLVRLGVPPSRILDL